MKQTDFLTLVKHPERVSSEHLMDLKELIDQYPSFVQPRILYTKLLQTSQSVHFSAQLQLTSLYTTNKRWLYYYLYPENKLSVEPYVRETPGNSHGDYFDMITSIEQEGGSTKQSLKDLASRLKSARLLVAHPQNSLNITETQKTNLNDTEKNQFETQKYFHTEQLAKKMIREKKYREAIEILRELNLNNPKKSVYFADQIRFLEKVIANSKK